MTCRRLPKTSLLVPLLAALAGMALPAAAGAQETVLQAENVRIDYARVLRVEPVFQTLSATSTEQQCDGDETASAVTASKGLSRIVGRVREALTPDERQVSGKPRTGCRMVKVQREYRRPIAYDVDYIYRGMKYRSRLGDDPGNRLRIRVSVMPYVAPVAH
jgi:uncharacterized protein YcfJ